jgi:hypothetical protein
MKLMTQDTTRRYSQQWFSTFVALVGLLLALAGAGCGSFTKSASESFASVTIQNHSMAEIGAVTARVFGAEGYQGGPTRGQPGKMMFQKEASRATSIAREGIVDAHYGERSLERVRVEIMPLADGSHRLQCKAFVVIGGSDPVFADEVPLANLRSGPYQAFLNEVRKQLK